MAQLKRLKSILPRGLLARSLLILVIPVFLIQIVTTVVFVDRHWRSMTARLAYAVAGEIATITSVIQNTEYPENFLQTIESALDLSIQLNKNQKLPPKSKHPHQAGWNAMVNEALSQELKKAIKSDFLVYTDLSNKEIRVFVELREGLLNISLPSRRLFSSSSYIFLLWMSGASIILLIVAILFMRNQIRPIRKLAVAAERFGKGRDVPVFKPSGAREVRQAAHSFIDMHKRIRRQVEQRTAMLAGVSHDLRTPLTRLKLALAMLEDTPETKAMQDDIKHMERMINGYLDFVRKDEKEAFSSIKLHHILKEALNKLTLQETDIRLEVPDDLHISVRPAAFERSLINIIGNSIAYADTVEIRTLKTDETLQIIIDDNGPGIPKDNYEDVFKPFYRLDTARGIETGGVGLGLPTALDIIHAHGGNITLSQSPLGGLRTNITLPL